MTNKNHTRIMDGIAGIGKKLPHATEMLIRNVGKYSTTFLIQNVIASSASGVLEQIGPIYLKAATRGTRLPRVQRS